MSDDEKERRKRRTHPGETPVPMLKVQNGRPVVRLVFFESTGGAGCGALDVELGAHGEVEAVVSRLASVQVGEERAMIATYAFWIEEHDGGRRG